ncbi:MAG: tail length tape measure protein [Cyanobacteria bacterium QS_8_64_29]|nr:MAG: tail length tape measure protein [Cyanobacteria bacterium QS_8_64_29]
MGPSRLVVARDRPLIPGRPRRRKRARFALTAAVVALLVWAGNALVAADGWIGYWNAWRPFWANNTIEAQPQGEAPVLSLALQSPRARQEPLRSLAERGDRSLASDRARYLLAVDAIAREDGEAALRWLRDLEWAYGAMAPQIAQQRARAYELAGRPAAALQAWQALLAHYPYDPVAAEALYALLGNDSPYRDRPLEQRLPDTAWIERLGPRSRFAGSQSRYWQIALSHYPSHPKVLRLIEQRLQANPERPQLMLALVRHSRDADGIIGIVDKLVERYRNAERDNGEPVIQAADWEAIAQVYWQAREYGKASIAYARAPDTPENAYQVALALEYAGQQQDAKRAYQRLVREFPQAEQSFEALLHLADFASDLETLPYLNRAIADFPEQAAEALQAKARTLEGLNNQKAAAQARQRLLDEYGDTAVATQYRTRQIQQKAKAGELETALNWARALIEQNPGSRSVRQNGFWAGKWALQLGREQQARQTFRDIIAHHPRSYYAWRSAVMLDWDVGDFDSIADRVPELSLPQRRPPLPAGTAVVGELYRLAQDSQAWQRWQGEVPNATELGVERQFAQGLLRLAIGERRQGIAEIEALSERQDPQARAQYRQYRQQRRYWEALYPPLYMEVIQASAQQQQLNPLLAISIIRQESGFKSDARSSANAVGLMQLRPDTGDWAARNLGLESHSLTDPQDNIRMGVWFLRWLHRRLDGNSLLAIASYNAGRSNVQDWVEERGGSIEDADRFVEDIPFPETRDYVKQVLGNYWSYRQLYHPSTPNRLTQASAAKR